MITSFKGKYSFLSSFYPVEIHTRGWAVPTLEHAYQLLKFVDVAQQREIAQAKTPGQAKKLGNHLKPIRLSWNADRLQVMRVLLHKKFSVPALAELLLATGDEKLVEGNYWNDTYWGVCRDRGANHLGLLLMEIREEIRTNNTTT